MINFTIASNLFRVTLLGLAVVFLLSCASPELKPIQFKPSQSGHSVFIHSDKSVIFEVVTGEVTGDSHKVKPLIDIIDRPAPLASNFFHAKDQWSFTDSLEAEISRLGILKVVGIDLPDSNQSDFYISIIFQSSYQQMAFNAYELSVLMKIQGGKRLYLKEYQINSAQGEGLVSRVTMDQQKAKQLVAEKLLYSIILDIQDWLAENSELMNTKSNKL